MPLTVNTGAASYLSATTYLGMHIDPRWVSEKVSVNGSGVGMNPDGTVNLTTLAADARLGKALARASGMVEAAATKGARYDPLDLAALTGNAQAFLEGVVADLTTGILMNDLRPDPTPNLTPSYLQALAWLEQLAQGERVFAFAETQQAGLIADEKDTPATVCARHGVVADARRFFGRRNNEEWWYGGFGPGW